MPPVFACLTIAIVSLGLSAMGGIACAAAELESTVVIWSVCLFK